LVLLDIDTVDKVVVNNLVDECSNIIRNAAVDSEFRAGSRIAEGGAKFLGYFV
jgi:hypothetical protein